MSPRWLKSGAGTGSRAGSGLRAEFPPQRQFALGGFEFREPAAFLLQEIELHAADGFDPSHPAFYLEGQEIAANNLRGFWVLNPCKEVGKGCTSGDECCGGFSSRWANRHGW